MFFLCWLDLSFGGGFMLVTKYFDVWVEYWFARSGLFGFFEFVVLMCCDVIGD